MFISVLNSGCLKTYYPSIHLDSASPMILEKNSKDSLSTQFLGADLLLSKTSYSNESFFLIRGNFTNTYTRDIFATNLKVFGYGDSYKVSDLVNYDGNKFVVGLGTEISAALNFKIDKFKMGFGVAGGVAAEFGDYYTFRKNASAKGIIKSPSSILNDTFSIFPIFSYQFSKSTLIPAQVNLGFLGLLSPIMTLNNKDFVYWISYLPYTNQNDAVVGDGLVLGFMLNLNTFK